MRWRDDELSRWLAEGYELAFRTAYLILHNRHDAEEAVQDAFLRAWRFRAAVAPGEGVRPWLYRVVVRACCSKLRTERRRRAVVADGDLDPLASEQQRLLLAALAKMPDDLRIVVALRYDAQLSEKEIASVIHRRPGTVTSRLHEARARLGLATAPMALAGTDSESGTDREGATTP